MPKLRYTPSSYRSPPKIEEPLCSFVPRGKIRHRDRPAAIGHPVSLRQIDLLESNTLAEPEPRGAPKSPYPTARKTGKPLANNFAFIQGLIAAPWPHVSAFQYQDVQVRFAQLDCESDPRRSGPYDTHIG